MTRLITEWINEPEGDLKRYEEKLIKMTGMTIAEMAFYAAGAPFKPKPEMKRHKAAVIRFTSGGGVIGSFAEAVAAVASHMGAETFISGYGDVAGIYEAVSRGAEILFMADDDRYIAVNVRTGAVSENDDCTALGYTAALSAAAGGLNGREVLLLGYGRVGKLALKYLLAEGAAVKVYDRDAEKTASLREEEAEVVSVLPMPLSGLVFDATDEGGRFGAGDISKSALIAAPGVPLSLDNESFLLYYDRVIHDPLHLGTAVMLAKALA